MNDLTPHSRIDTNTVYSITGEKINSLLLNEESLRFSSGRAASAEEFEAAWQRKLTIATKLQIKHDSIRSITKEEGDSTIRISYKTRIGISGGCEFSFTDEANAQPFLNYMEKEQYLTLTHEQLTPFKAAFSYLLGLAFAIAMTWFSWYLVTGKDPEFSEDSGSGKTRLFMHLINFLGEKGVLAVGIGICTYILFKIWKRTTNPPHRTRLARV